MNDLISSLNSLNNNEAGLPSPKAAGLPSVKGAAVPSGHDVAGLPSPKGAMPMGGLPSPKGAMPTGGLPSPKANPNDTNLGIRAHAGESARRPLINNGLEGHQAPPAAPAQSFFNQQLNPSTQRKNTVALSSIDFDRTSYSSQEIRPVPLHASGTEQVRLSDADSSLNIPKLKMGDAFTEPTLKSGYQEPAAFNPTHDINEDSGLPLMDDPLSLMGSGDPLFPPHASSQPKPPTHQRKPSSSIPKDKLDLFSGLGDAIKMPEDITPIPTAMGGSAAIHTGNDATPIPQAKRGSMASAMPAAGGDLKEVGGELIEADDEDGDELVFELNSIKSDEKTAAKTLTAAKTETEKKVELKLWQKKVFLVPVICTVLAVIAILTMVSIVYQAKNVSEEELAYLPEQAEVNINWNSIKTDSLTHYEKFYNDARDKIKSLEDGQERSDLQGQILTAMVFSVMRFPEQFKAEVEILDASTEKLSESCDSDWCSFGLWAWGEMRNDDALKTKFTSKIPQSETFNELAPIIKAAAQYINWTSENVSYADYLKVGQNILTTLSHANISKNWPVGAWLKASTHKRLGAHQEALQTLTPLTADETTPYPSLLQLEAELNLGISKADTALQSIKRVLAVPYLSPKEKLTASNTKLIAESQTETWDAFQKNLIDHGKKFGKEPSVSSAIAEACIYSNLAEKCRVTIQSFSDMMPNNAEMRNAYFHILAAMAGYQNIVRPDKHLNKNIITLLTTAADAGIKLDPKNIVFWKHKVLASFAANDFDAAIDAIDEIERGEKLNWFGSYLKQMIAYQDADDDQKQEIRKALIASAKSLSGTTDSIILAHVLNYVDESIVALDVLNQAAKLYPENTLVLDTRFELAVSLGNKDVAEQSAKLLDQRSALMTQHEFEYAKLIEMRGDPNAALERMLTLIGQDPENAVYLAYIGELFFKQKQCDSAMPYLAQTLEINPNNADARFYRGHCHYNAGQFEDALNEFNEAATQDETNLLYVLWIGKCLAGLNQLMEAHRSFTTVIDAFNAQDNENKQVHDPANLPEAYYQRAEIRKYQNRRTEARDDYMKALQYSPENVDYLSGYSIYLYENGNLNECINHVTQIENILGDHVDPRLFFVRGQSYLKTNQRSEAIRDLEYALKLGFADLPDPGIIGIRESAEIYESLGYLYRDLGKRESARKALTSFLEKSTAISPKTRKEIQSEIEKI